MQVIVSMLQVQHRVLQLQGELQVLEVPVLRTTSSPSSLAMENQQPDNGRIVLRLQRRNNIVSFIIRACKINSLYNFVLFILLVPNCPTCSTTTSEQPSG